jgi:hypothetical protein
MFTPLHRLKWPFLSTKPSDQVAATLGADILKAYEAHKNEQDTQQKARRVSRAVSTFSEEEVKAMLERLQGCRDRFIKQAGGKERVMCICSVLNEVKLGNGGVLPSIDDWDNIYATLCQKS